MGWAGHTAHVGEKRNKYKCDITINLKMMLEICRRRWNNNVKMEFTEMLVKHQSV